MLTLSWWQRQLDVAMDGRGGAVATWVQEGHAWASRYRPGDGWDEAAIVDDSVEIDASAVDVTLAPDGTALVLFWDFEWPSAAGVWAAVLPP